MRAERSASDRMVGFCDADGVVVVVRSAGARCGRRRWECRVFRGQRRYAAGRVSQHNYATRTLTNSNSSHRETLGSRCTEGISDPAVMVTLAAITPAVCRRLDDSDRKIRRDSVVGRQQAARVAESFVLSATRSGM